MFKYEMNVNKGVYAKALLAELSAAGYPTAGYFSGEGLSILSVYQEADFTGEQTAQIDGIVVSHVGDTWDTPLGTVGTHTLSADKVTITANDVDAATVTVAPASGEYAWSLWLDGERVASSATLGTIDAADGYALAITADGAGVYILRVIQAGTYKQITITAVE